MLSVAGAKTHEDCRVSYCAHLDVLQVWWRVQKQSKSISQLCQTLQPVAHRPVDRRWALLQSPVSLVVCYEGKQAITLQPLKGNAEPLQAAKTAKSSQNSVSNIDINTDVHTYTQRPCLFHVHKHTRAFLFFPSWPLCLAENRTDCLLLWLWPSL